jgi:radical SAM superfamily enzyme YgiQ (UPF0313 family)
VRPLNYLLVMPRLVQNVGDGYSFPLGIAYVSAALKKAGFNVTALNLNHREGDVAEILRDEIRARAIDVVATGGLSFQYSTVRKVIESSKRARPDVITIVGGGIITSDPEPAMTALEFADYGVVGEGELTAVELARALEAGESPSAVSGLIYRGPAGAWLKTPARKEIRNIDELAWPDYEGFDLKKFFDSSPSISGLNRKNTVFMIASRSCPYNCTFCFHTVGRKYRQRTLDNFFAELDHMVKTYDIHYICLADELFSNNIERLKEFCARIKKYNLRWWAQFRVDCMTSELLTILKEGGCDVMSFGLESADNRVLKSMRKNTTVEQIESTLKMVYDAGISMEGAFIFGDIEETWETANNTLQWWRDHAEYKINLNLITVYPGSYLYQYACEKGIIQDKVQFLKDGCPQIKVSKLTDEQFAVLIRNIMEAPMTLAKVMSTVEVNEIDSAMGRISVSGTCTACRHANRWDNIKLFTTNFLGCQKCGQRYNIVLPDEIRRNIDDNVTRLIERFGKVAVWGVNYHTADLFKHSHVLSGPGVYPVDISGTKRMMDLYGKKILDPDVIRDEDIAVAIVAIPVYFSQIDGNIRLKYPNVKRIYDICQLAEPLKPEESSRALAQP